jgi:putative membrane protein
MASCDTSSQQTDSTEVAEEQNEERLPSDDAQDDAEFMVKAASGGMMEVELGRMAQQKASSPQVKEFAGMMVNDHSKANEELKALATKKNIVLPSTPGDEAQGHISELTKYSGSEFDKEYMNLMTKDHQEDISLFEKAAEKSKDQEVVAFAAKTLPVLRKHHQMARQLEDVTSDVNTRADNRSPSATGAADAHK